MTMLHTQNSITEISIVWCTIQLCSGITCGKHIVLPALYHIGNSLMLFFSCMKNEWHAKTRAL